ncbi:hypothetical protein ACFY19_00640 [Streptosporangium saharense]|uniref:hypothetical protein n=1 Tax=Streptosporangium saharense TaxID=1706840 RepID=UPI003680AE38
MNGDHIIQHGEGSVGKQSHSGSGDNVVGGKYSQAPARETPAPQPASRRRARRPSAADARGASRTPAARQPAEAAPRRPRAHLPWLEAVGVVLTAVSGVLTNLLTESWGVTIIVILVVLVLVVAGIRFVVQRDQSSG